MRADLEWIEEHGKVIDDVWSRIPLGAAAESMRGKSFFPSCHAPVR